MKKAIVILMIAALTLTALTGCGSKADPATDVTTEAAETTAAALEAETTAPTADVSQPAETAATAAADTTAPAESTAPSAPEATTAPAAAPASVEEIVALYNAAVNKVKPQAKSITRTYHHVSIPTDTLELPSAIQGIDETAIKQFVKGSDEPQVWTTREDFNLGFPVGGTDYSSKPTPDMVKSAACTDNGATYTVRIALKNDTFTNPQKGQGYAGVFNTVAASTFDEISIPTVTFEKVSINGINGSISCTIDKATQRVTDITFANTDVLDLNVKVAFSSLHAKMNLVCEDNYKITY